MIRNGTIRYFFAIFLLMLVLILSPDVLSATKSWKYTIVNHTGYDIVVFHENCISDEWNGDSPCYNFSDVKISSKTSASRDQTASKKGRKKGQVALVLKIYEKGTSNLLFTYNTSTIDASEMALSSPYYVQEVSGSVGGWLRNIWVRSSNENESFFNMYSPVESNWMASVDDNKTIAQIAIPGTHNSGAFDSSYACECQTNSPGQQLDSGVRSFDFRLECYDNELFLTHGKKCKFDHEHRVSQYLDYFSGYLRRYPSETIMIHVKEEDKPTNCGNYGNNTGKAFKALLEQKEAEGLKIMKDYNGEFPILGKVRGKTLGEVRGKVMILYEAGVYYCCNFPIEISWPDQTHGYESCWGDKDSKFYIEDAYREKSKDKWDIVRPLLGAASSNSDPQKMYYTYTSTTAPGAPNPAAQASDINKWLAVWLSQNPDKTPVGAIITDYINCAKFGGIVVTQYCDEGGYDYLPFMIYSTNY